MAPKHVRCQSKLVKGKSQTECVPVHRNQIVSRESTVRSENYVLIRELWACGTHCPWRIINQWVSEGRQAWPMLGLPISFRQKLRKADCVAPKWGIFQHAWGTAMKDNEKKLTSSECVQWPQRELKGCHLQTPYAQDHSVLSAMTSTVRVSVLCCPFLLNQGA